MSVEYCHNCGKYIDTDYDAEHGVFCLCENESWAYIDGYSGLYKVSSFGRVLALSKKYVVGNTIRSVNEKLMKPIKTNYGYLQINLTKNGVQRCYRLHRLVANAFIENSDNKPYVNHIDHNKENNIVSNLEWCTHIENMQHANMQCGVDRHNAKLNRKKVLAIKSIYKSGLYTQRELAKKFNVSQGVIFQVLHKKTWKHLRTDNALH